MTPTATLWLVSSCRLRFISNEPLWSTNISTPILRKYLIMACLQQILCAQDYVFECFEPGQKPRVLRSPFLRELVNDCENATKISLRSPEILDANGLMESELDTLFNVAHLDMCIEVSHTLFSKLNMLMKRLTGRCKGPVLDIIGNDYLTNLRIGEFVKNMESDSIRIRGNPRLTTPQLIPFNDFSDIQGENECLLPARFMITSQLDKCDSVYGVIKVKNDIAFYQSLRDHSFTGCVQISSNFLADVEFLNHFKPFTHIPNCHQYIANSTNLCVKNRSWLRATFGDIDIYNNKPNCDSQCPGGLVTEAYLSATDTCETRIGDVIIKNWKGKPNNVDVLYKTKHIEGRLIIADNVGLGNFDYFKNLEEVGTPMIPGNEPALVVENNADLKTLEMPKLSTISNFDKTSNTRFRNNSELKLPKIQVNTFNVAAGGSHHTHHTKKRRGWSLLVVLLLVVLLLLVLFLIALILFAGVKLKSSGKQLKGLVGLSQKSQAILADMCKEIVEKNPFVWMIQDRPLIWRYSVEDPKRSEIDQLKEKHATFLENHALKILPNARIPSTSERCVIDRVSNMVKHEEVLIISTDDDISLIIPLLPNEIGGEHTYNGRDSSITFYLQTIKSSDDLTRRYLYKVAISQDGKLSKKKLRVHLYVWDPLRLPISFEDLRRLVAKCSRRKMTCISDRRKEIFSLLHMIFTYVNVLQQSIGVVEAFQLHTDTVNGAPLDCCEMLCVMAFILEWAHQTYSVPKEIEKKHCDWCHTYARMSKFYSDHPNIMIVQPENLITSRKSPLREEISQAGPSAGESLSERHRELTIDKFRRRTPIELKSQPQQQPQVIRKEDDGTTVNETCTTLPYQYRGKPGDPYEKKVIEALRRREKT